MATQPQLPLAQCHNCGGPIYSIDPKTGKPYWICYACKEEEEAENDEE